MIPLPVSARGLRRRTVLTQEGPLDNVDLFPFFESRGRVKYVIIMTPSTGQIYAFPWREDLFRVPLWGPIVLGGQAARPTRITRDHLDDLAWLWHFDPWWTLDADAYAAHWASEPLKATNCAGRCTPTVQMVYFKRDLSALKYVTLKRRGQISIVAWRSDVLPTRPVKAEQKPKPTRPRPATWRLDPIWEQRTNVEQRR